MNIVQLQVENLPSHKMTTGIDNISYTFKFRYNQYLDVFVMDVESAILTVKGVAVRAGIDLFENYGVKYKCFFFDRLDRSNDSNMENFGITGFVYVSWDDE